MDYGQYASTMPADMGMYGQDAMLRAIQESIADELEDARFYDALAALAPTSLERQIIAKIRDDERKHANMLRQMYVKSTGYQPPMSKQATENRPRSYFEGVEKAILGELMAFEKYRDLYLRISPMYKNLLFEIMTDEIKHAGYFNWIFTRNKR